MESKKLKTKKLSPAHALLSKNTPLEELSKAKKIPMLLPGSKLPRSKDSSLKQD